MTTDPKDQPRPKHFLPHQGDRRQVDALRGVPLIGGLGLVFNDRRSHRERRRKRRKASPPPPCALLQRKEDGPPARGLLRNVTSGWDSSALGAWIRRRLKNPWRR